MNNPSYREFLTDSLDRIRWAGVRVLDDMENAKELTHEERRALQCEFVGGVNDAHFAMAEPLSCVRAHGRSNDDGIAEAKRRYDLRKVVEDWLEHNLGPGWRRAKIPADLIFATASQGEFLARFRDSVLARPDKKEGQ